MKINQNKNKEEFVIKVDNLSKTFRIPHEKHTTLKQAALNVFSPKSYGTFTALKEVSFDIKKGEFFGIIGRNGSGKSTLLKILAGIYMPDKGKVTVKGKLSPFLELGVGFNPELTARENVFLGGAILGLSREEISKKFDEIISFAELEEFVDMKFKNFSSGMQVRLAFALSIYAHAEILLMDEVLAVGDNSFQNKCLKVFNDYRDQGKTVILVTHDIGTVQRYCDRAMLLKNGKISKLGSADDVVNEYIQQNIELEALKKTSKTKEKNEKQRKIAEIKSIKFFDKGGKEKYAFETGEAISAKIAFKRNFPRKIINIGLGIYKDDGSYVFSYNTWMDNHKISGDSVELIFENFPLLQGAYSVNVVCFGEIEQGFYDFKDKIVTFRMFPTIATGKYRGTIHLEHKWK